MGFGPMNNYYHERLKKYRKITILILFLSIINLVIIMLMRPNYLYQICSLITYIYLGYEFGARRIIIYPNLIIILLFSIIIQIGLLV